MNDGDTIADVLVIGAGPAGSAAAATAASAGARLVWCDRGRLPRHRLCGEFVSPEALADLQALGLDVARIESMPVDRALVTAARARAEAPLRHPGVAISRHVLDAWLAAAAAARGARLLASTRVVAVTGSLRDGFRVELEGEHGGCLAARTVIGACGRRDLEPAPARRAGHVALKTHRLGGASAPAGVELHAFPGGYVGRVRVGPDRVNVCAVANRDAIRRVRGGGLTGALAALVAQVPALRDWWQDSREDESARAGASELAFGVVRPVWKDVFRAGDAAALPHPLSGDGIAMALRGGRLAAQHALAFLAAKRSADEALSEYERAWRDEFAARLRWDALLHEVLGRPALVSPVVRALARWPRAFDALVARTRGAVETPTVVS